MTALIYTAAIMMNALFGIRNVAGLLNFKVRVYAVINAKIIKRSLIIIAQRKVIAKKEKIAAIKTMKIKKEFVDFIVVRNLLLKTLEEGKIFQEKQNYLKKNKGLVNIDFIIKKILKYN